MTTHLRFAGTGSGTACGRGSTIAGADRRVSMVDCQSCLEARLRSLMVDGSELRERLNTLVIQAAVRDARVPA